MEYFGKVFAEGTLYTHTHMCVRHLIYSIGDLSLPLLVIYAIFSLFAVPRTHANFSRNIVQLKFKHHMELNVPATQMLQANKTATKMIA